MTRSEYVCGRTANANAFKLANSKGGCFVVTSFTTRDGRRMYADATYIGRREDYLGAPLYVAGQHRYRVIVTPKQKGTKTMTKKLLEDWMADSAGKKAPTDIHDNFYFHPKTGGTYIVVGHCFDVERERWVVMYRKWDVRMAEPKGQIFVHLPEDFLRDGRFVEVKG